jgi:hypothetical protein
MEKSTDSITPELEDREDQDVVIHLHDLGAPGSLGYPPHVDNAAHPIGLVLQAGLEVKAEKNVGGTANQV